MKLFNKFTIALLIILSFACKKDCIEAVETNPTPEVNTGTLKLMFQNKMSNLAGVSTDLLLGDTIYKTGNGDTLSLSSLKYFVSNVKLIDSEGDTTTVEESYHLVQSTAMMAMSTFELSIPEGNYESIVFSLGVDSAANMDETVIEGDLDPNTNMVWNWNIGYKFLLLEGAYNHNSTNGALSYHIGLNANYVTYEKDLPMTLQIKDSQTSMIHVMANFDNLFNGTNTIDVETVNNVKVGPEDQVSQLVTNYVSSFFMVHHIENAE
jgi:hypothetical protein